MAGWRSARHPATSKSPPTKESTWQRSGQRLFKETTGLWFLDSLVEIRSSKANGGPVSALEVTVPPGDTAPPHAQDEDERIYVLEGSATFFVGDEIVHARPGEKVFIPRGRLHAHRASDFGAPWIVLTESGHFEDFVRDVSRPAPATVLPPRGALAREETEELTDRARARNRVFRAARGAADGSLGVP